MTFSTPKPQYDANDEAQFRAAVQQALDQLQRRGGDVEVAGGARFIMTTPAGVRYSVAISNTPAITFTAA